MRYLWGQGREVSVEIVGGGGGGGRVVRVREGAVEASKVGDVGSVVSSVSDVVIVVS